MKALGTFQDSTMPVGSKETVNGVQEAYVAGAATFSNAGGVPYIVGFRSDGGTLKINGFLFNVKDGVIAGGVEPEPPAKAEFDD